MLDDLAYIHQTDKSDALGVIAQQWQQLSHAFDVHIDAIEDLRNVVVSGMGGSAWPAFYMRSWPGVKSPLEVNRTYDIPAYVNKHTLFIATSYSGNTEETLETLKKAEQAGANIVVISAGGALTARAEEAGYPLYHIPSGIQPRMSSFYFIAAYIHLFRQVGILAQAVSEQDLADLGEWLHEHTKSWLPEVPVAQNPAKQLALNLAGTTPIMYSGPLLAPVANKMKICMNENAKNLSWWNEFPEFSHNEFIGWSSHPVDKPFGIVELRSPLEHARVQKRFEVTERMLSGKRPHPYVVHPEGTTLPQHIFWTSMFGDFVCTYLALLNGVDPTPVDLVEKFKKALNE